MSRRPLRPEAARELEGMTDYELLEIFFFGNLHSDPFTKTFVATLAQRREAEKILEARGTRIPANARRPPDPRVVLSGRAEDQAQYHRDVERYNAARADALRDGDLG